MKRRDACRGLAVSLTTILIAVTVAFLHGYLTSGDGDGARAITGSNPAVVVPMGGVPKGTLATVTRRLAEMGFTPNLWPPLRPSSASADANRHQRMADVMLDQVLATVPGALGESGPLVIAVTVDDMYWVGRPEWGFSFSVRQDTRGAILSTARMDERSFGLASNDLLLRRRLDKMLVRVVGLGRLSAPRVADPKCANRVEVLSVDDLDQMRPNLCQPPSVSGRTHGL